MKLIDHEPVSNNPEDINSPNAFITQQNYKEQKYEQEMNISHQYLHNNYKDQYEENLTPSQCSKLLKKCNIASHRSPHQLTPILMLGQLICSPHEQFFLNQKQLFSGSAICLQNCICMQINYKVAKQIIKLVSSDKQKQYIRAVLFTFPMLRYGEALRYVTRQYMISNEQQSKQQKQQKQKPQDHQDQQNVLNSKSKPITRIKQLKIISGSNLYIQKTGSIYLIISGKVTISIDIISQKKPSLNQYIITHKNYHPRQLLTLTTYDLFGFEQITSQQPLSPTKLRYIVSDNSKLLKLNKQVFEEQLEDNSKFKNYISQYKINRNVLMRELMEKIQKNIQRQEISKHQVITFGTKSMDLYRKGRITGIKQPIKQQNKQQKSQKVQINKRLRQVKQVRYLGHKNFESVKNRIQQHFSPQSTAHRKQSLSPEIISDSGLGLQFSKNLIMRDNQIVQIKNGWIEVRNKKGTLLRKKRIKSYEENVNSLPYSQLQEPIIPSTQKILAQKSKKDQILHKLGILDSQQIAQHNYHIVHTRKSNYQFQDLHKQAKQFQRIKQKSNSLPRLTNFYAKKQNRIFSIMNKRKNY